MRIETVLAERIVADAIAGCIASRKMLVERLYPMLNRHEIAGADGGALQVEIEAAARELDRLLAPHLESEATAEHLPRQPPSSEQAAP